MTPAGTSNELDVENKWEENTNTHYYYCPLLYIGRCNTFCSSSTTTVDSFFTLLATCRSSMQLVAIKIFLQLHVLFVWVHSTPVHRRGPGLEPQQVRGTYFVLRVAGNDSGSVGVKMVRWDVG